MLTPFSRWSIQFVRRLPPLDTSAHKAARSTDALSHDEVVERELAMNTIFNAPHPESLIPTPVGSKENGERVAPFRGESSQAQQQLSPCTGDESSDCESVTPLGTRWRQCLKNSTPTCVFLDRSVRYVLVYNCIGR